MIAKGKAICYGDNVDTDVIIPARYLNVPGAEELAKHCMEDLDPTFVKRVCPGDIVVAARNFGCGSSREHAPIALKASGVSCVIAKSFARIFYRNAINIGLPILECAEADKIHEGDELEIIFETGEIRNLTEHATYQSMPFPPFMQEIIRDNGLIAHLRREKS